MFNLNSNKLHTSQNIYTKDKWFVVPSHKEILMYVQTTLRSNDLIKGIESLSQTMIF